MDIKRVDELKIKLFADGADKQGMLDMYARSCIKGFTTNPSLMRNAGIADYKAFALDVLADIKDKPVSFEALSDDFADMQRQADEIASWADNVYVKIPVTNSQGESSQSLIKRLTRQGVKVNVTALMSLNQVRDIIRVLNPDVPSYLSVFAGRIADTGRDPVPMLKSALEWLKPLPKAELIWASPRELLNIYQADAIGCHIITVMHSILNKLNLVGYCLDQYSLDTVKMFHDDARMAGFEL